MKRFLLGLMYSYLAGAILLCVLLYLFALWMT